MKIAHYDQIITPEVGEPAAGYGVNDVTVRIHDDLKVSILLLDDGDAKGAVLSYDLLGLDETFIRKIRKNVAAQLGCPETNVILRNRAAPPRDAAQSGPADGSFPVRTG